MPLQVNRSDGPSRQREIEPPTKDEPDWFLRLKAGNYGGFDAVVASSPFPLNAARWVRFLLLLWMWKKIRVSDPGAKWTSRLGHSNCMKRCFRAFCIGAMSVCRSHRERSAVTCRLWCGPCVLMACISLNLGCQDICWYTRSQLRKICIQLAVPI